MRPFRRGTHWFRSVYAVFLLVPARADDPDITFFETKIRPVLVEHCYKCHSADAKKPGGGLLLDSRDGVRKGGESGEAIEPGRPEDSLLIKAIRYDDESIKMPPKGKLPASVVADIEAWVKNGAPDPRDTPSPACQGRIESWDETIRRRRDWWSLKPVRAPVVPHPKNGDWCEQPVDRFILARLEDEGFRPAEPADPSTLARRLCLVLMGLPPTPEQVEQLLAEPGDSRELDFASPEAVARLVDSLLASPHFGERWARHWMDVVRFSETHGNEWNYEVHHAWRYRDYLIRAFNADVPYDQLVREQIAGDLLPSPRWNEREQFNESVIGTGFYRFGEVNHDDCISLRQIGYDLADNQIDTLTKAFQATTVACARCHNHKLDAVSMDDYYALLGVVRSSRMVSHSIDDPDVDAQTRQRLRELKAELRASIAEDWLGETREFARYMQAAQARRASRPAETGLDAARLKSWVAVLTAKDALSDDPFDLWRTLSAPGVVFPAKWRESAEKFAKEDRERAEFNRTHFVTFADFRDGGNLRCWQVGGREQSSPPARRAVATSK